ncbi:MAG: hypothetical protein H6733_03405 [Alphaproteobacteria bacterium]|nr:hypothetical protein [Alphaproteobacteria bacterium]
MSASVLLLVAVFVLVALLLANKVMESGKGGVDVISRERTTRAAGLGRRFHELAGDQRFDQVHVGLDGRGAVGWHEGDGRLFVVTARWEGDDGRSLAEPELHGLALRAADVVDVVFREMSVVRGDKADTSDRIYAVEVLVFVDDLTMPVVPLAFVDAPVFAGSLAHENARDTAQRWEGALKVLADRARRGGVDLARAALRGTPAAAVRPEALRKTDGFGRGLVDGR